MVGKWELLLYCVSFPVEKEIGVPTEAAHRLWVWFCSVMRLRNRYPPRSKAEIVGGMTLGAGGWEGLLLKLLGDTGELEGFCRELSYWGRRQIRSF